ncbi:hypothetical protein Pfo_011456, partial [Paulownia fortunei]
AWAYFREDVVPDGKKSWTCLHCNNVWRGGGINRMKKHLAGRKGDIAPGKKVSYDVRYQMEQSLKECDKRNQAARSFEDDNLCGPNLIELEEEMHTPHIQTRGKANYLLVQLLKREKESEMIRCLVILLLELLMVHNLPSKVPL